MELTKASGKRRARRLPTALIIAALSAALVGAGGVAYAGTTYENFNSILPVGQFPASTTFQTKTSTGVSGNIRITSIGSTYQVDAQMCSLYGAYCGGGTKVYYLDDGDSSTLPNSYSGGGQHITSNLQTSTWNSVTVQVIGSWRSN